MMRVCDFPLHCIQLGTKLYRFPSMEFKSPDYAIVTKIDIEQKTITYDICPEDGKYPTPYNYRCPHGMCEWWIPVEIEGFEL